MATTYTEIQLTAVDWRNEQRQPTAGYPASMRVVGEDDLENEIEAEPAPTQTATYPICINVEEIREYYPRRGDKIGTRIVYKNGAARPVTELIDVVQRKIKEAALRKSRRPASETGAEQ